MSDRDDLARLIFVADNWKQSEADSLNDWDAWTGGGKDSYAHRTADAILAAGWVKPRTITTRAEANSLPDRSAFITPGEIIFRKWENYYGEGKHAWERELGQMVPAEMLSESGHFPAVVLHEPV